MKGKFAQDLLEIQRRKSCPAVVGDGKEANSGMPAVTGARLRLGYLTWEEFLLQ